MIWHISPTPPPPNTWWFFQNSMVLYYYYYYLLLVCQPQEWNCRTTQNFLKTSRSLTFWCYGVNTFWQISDELTHKKHFAQSSIHSLPLGMAFWAAHRGHPCSRYNTRPTYSESWRFSFGLSKSFHPSFWSCSASQMYHQKLKRFKYFKCPGVIAVVQYHLYPNHHNVPKYIYEDLKINYFSSKYLNYSNQSPLFR